MAFPLSGTTDIPTAGTSVRINNTPRRCLKIIFKPRTANTGNIFIGGSAVSSTAGYAMAPSDAALTVDIGTLGVSCLMSDFYLDTATGGNDVDWLAIVEG